jgi:hypothetical protein
MKRTRPSHQMIASMRGNLRQLLSIPEDARSERQRKAIIKILGHLNNIRQLEIDKSRRMAERFDKLKGENLVFENTSLAVMVLRTLAYLSTEDGFITGHDLSDMTDGNPLISGAGLDQLEHLGYIKRHADGAVSLLQQGMKLI